MTDEQIMALLEAIEGRAARATEGPWYIHDDKRKWVTSDERDADWRGNRDNDATFIAHARTDVPALVGLVRRLVAERDAARALLSDASEAIWHDTGGAIRAVARRIDQFLESPTPSESEHQP